MIDKPGDFFPLGLQCAKSNHINTFFYNNDCVDVALVDANITILARIPQLVQRSHVYFDSHDTVIVMGVYIILRQMVNIYTITLQILGKEFLTVHVG